ncbi:MAG TPA: hypothetical protein VJX67_25775 [Blastocatellia bacterium]|nr:hypothetical protein [Blastocatellia bacterium]
MDEIPCASGLLRGNSADPRLEFANRARFVGAGELSPAATAAATEDLAGNPVTSIKKQTTAPALRQTIAWNERVETGLKCDMLPSMAMCSPDRVNDSGKDYKALL